MQAFVQMKLGSEYLSYLGHVSTNPAEYIDSHMITELKELVFLEDQARKVLSQSRLLFD
jgi:hypothetical protein